MSESKKSMNVVVSMTTAEWSRQSAASELPECGVALHTIDICRTSYHPKNSSEVKDRDEKDNEEKNDHRYSIVFGGASGLLCLHAGLNFI